jgi:ABC-2 type transport system ATP-binding protein
VAIGIRGLTKRFPVRRTWGDVLRHPFSRETKTVLSDVSLSVRPRELFGLLGPNGAGKTTLFKILATLVWPDEGGATVLGHDVLLEPGRVKRVLNPVIPDERSLYWRLSAQENLRLFSWLYGLRSREVDVRIGEVLEAVELLDTEDRMVGTFSSGMRQRLLIARALLSRPKVLLLDEPTRSLDPISARGLRERLRDEIVGRQGCTVLLATHNPDEALGLCDRLAVLHEGRLLATGSGRELGRLAGDHRYRFWTRSSPEPGPAAVVERMGLQLGESEEAEDPGWISFEVDIPGGPDQAARLLSALTDEGMQVSRFERIEPSLPDLLARIVTLRGGGGDG